MLFTAISKYATRAFTAVAVAGVLTGLSVSPATTMLSSNQGASAAITSAGFTTRNWRHRSTPIQSSTTSSIL